MGFFNRGKMQRAEEFAVHVGENLINLGFISAERSPSEVVRDVALHVCAANAFWAMSDETIVRHGQHGPWATQLSEIDSPLELLGVVLNAELREQARLPEKDHLEVLARATRRLSAIVEQRAVSEIGNALLEDMEQGTLSEPIGEPEDDHDALEEAQSELCDLAEALVGASAGSAVMAQVLSENQIRPLFALRMFVEKHPDWSLYDGRLKFRDAVVGHFSNENQINEIFTAMVSAFLQDEYSQLSAKARPDLALYAMLTWDRALQRMG